MKKIFFIFMVVACLAVGGQARAQSDELPDAIISPGQNPGHILVVDKSSQILYLYGHDGKGAVSLEKIMSCSTGKRQGDKMVEGDKKTPEGLYIFVEKKLPREMSPIFGILAYPTDYPNFWDRHLGRGGYGIWMHGIDKKLKDYDSNGCIELENANIAAMEDLIQLYDTPIIIYETVTMAPVERLAAQGQKVVGFIESWGRAWFNKDYEAYESHYAPDFVNSDGQSYAEWMAHKRKVGAQASHIRLVVTGLKMFRHRDVIVAIFQQEYQVDDGFASSGLKRLYLKSEGESFKIVGEEFQPLPDKTTTKWLTAGQKRQALGEAFTEPKAVERNVLREGSAETAQGVGENSGRPDSATGTEIQPTASGEGDTASLQGRLGPLPTLTETTTPLIESTEDKKNLEPSESRTLTRAEEEALVREEARLNQEMAQVRVAASETETRQIIQRDRQRSQRRVTVPPDFTLESEARALAAARAKLSGQAMTQEQLKEHLISLTRTWGAAWNSRDLEAYFAFYDPGFYFSEKNLDLLGFIAYRGDLIKSAGILEIELSYFSVSFQGDLALVKFRQAYRSDHVRDLGIKTLTFKDNGSGWKIIAETWQSL